MKFFPFFRVVAAETSEGVLTANEIRRFLLQCTHDTHPSSSSSPCHKRRTSSGGDSGGPGGVGVGVGRSGSSGQLDKLKESELNEMLLALDLDKDGKVKLDDFLRLLVPCDVAAAKDPH